MKKPGDAVRAKDLYDVSRIRRVHELEQVEFWRLAGVEFRVACRARKGDASIFRHGSDAGNRISRFAQLGTAGERKSARDSVGRG